MISDSFNLTVTLPHCTESAALGGCLQALSTINQIPLDKITQKHCMIQKRLINKN